MDDDDDYLSKLIIYIQTDLSKCVFQALSDRSFETTLVDGSASVESRCSFLKTKGLIETFKADVESNESLPHHACYAFKVVHRGIVHSLTNSQFQAKLRADIHIEIIPVEKAEEMTSSGKNVV